MKLDQLCVFIENRSGRLAKIATTLGDANVNIRAMSLADTSDFGILRLIVDDVQKARSVLKSNGFTIRISQVIAVEIQDRPGRLGKFLATIEQAGLNVEYMYAYVQKSGENAVIIFRFEDLDKAIDVIREAGMTVLSRDRMLAL